MFCENMDSKILLICFGGVEGRQFYLTLIFLAFRRPFVKFLNIYPLSIQNEKFLKVTSMLRDKQNVLDLGT